MITRYLLLIGGSRDERSVMAARAATTAALDTTDLDETATLSSSQPVERGEDRWPVVIGDVFRAADRIAPTGRRWRSPSAMLSDCWGRYVALWREGADYIMLRDPSGGLPGYYRKSDEIVAIASDLELLDMAAPEHRHLDWTEIGRILVARDLRSEATAIIGTSELPAGSTLTIAPSGLRSAPLWNPWKSAAHEPEKSGEASHHRLRATIGWVVAGLASGRPRAVALISGGLDSSIVATMLGAQGIALTNLTLATLDPSGDERRYAALVAEANGGDYVERFFEPAHVELGRSQAAHLPRPVGRPFAQSTDRILIDVCRERDVDAVFTGTGGDNVFCFLQSATPIADRVLAEGSHAALPSIADMARLTGTSYAAVARATLRRLLPWRRAFSWPLERRFLDNDAARLISRRPVHPWLQRPAGSRIGTAVHLALILRSQNDTEGLARSDDIDLIHPLLSQPVMETCLSIPSWRWCEGGVDRAVARRAFADTLPGPILRRRWKGGPDSFVAALVERHRGILHSRLVGGMLAEHGLLDRPAIAAVLNDPRPVASGDAVRLLTLSDAEAWVRHHYRG